MKILVNLFNYEINYWLFEHLFREYRQITKLDYIETHNGGLDSWRQLMPDIRKAITQFGKHDLDWKHMSRFDQRRWETINALPAHVQFYKGDPRENPAMCRKRVSKSKRRAYLLYYYYLWQLKDYDMLFVCNGMETEHQAAIKAAHFLNKKIAFFEIGPFKNTITIDTKGPNYQNSLPRNINFYRQWSKANPSPPQTASINTRIIDYIDFFSKDKPDLSHPYIFLPLQAYNDTQILFFNDWVKDIPHLITLAQKASALLPKGWHIIAKEHPACRARFDCKQLERERFIFANGHKTPTLIKNASLILTLNSSVGLEAMLFDKPVITLGKAFFAFDSLTHQCHNEIELMEAIKKPEQIKFSRKDRQTFLSYLINEYYLDGSLHKKIFARNKKNRRIIQHTLGLEWKPRPRRKVLEVWKQIFKHINPRQSPREQPLDTREQPLDKRLALSRQWQKEGIDEISKPKLFVATKNKVFIETTQKKNLVIVRAGENSLHEDWLKTYTYDQRNWDLLVSYYDVPSKSLRDDIMNIYYKGGSKDGIYDAFQQVPHLLEKYDYIMMADDDFQMTAQDLNRTFEIMKEYNLQIGQPSFTYDSYNTYWQLFYNPYFKIRYTNFAEANTVCLHRKIFQQILPLYEDNPHAWFLDTFWNRLTDNPARQVAMIDEIQVKHTRALKTGELHQHYLNREGPLKYSILGHSRGSDRDDRDKLILEKIVTHAGILQNGRTINGRWLTLLFLFAGWLKAAKHVDRSRNLNNRSVHKSIRLALENQIKGKIRLTNTRLVIHGRYDE